MKFTNRRIANTIIISTLLVASIASIGFSSWLIEGGGVKEDNGVVYIEVGKVGDFTDCVIEAIYFLQIGGKDKNLD